MNKSPHGDIPRIGTEHEVQNTQVSTREHGVEVMSNFVFRRRLQIAVESETATLTRSMEASSIIEEMIGNPAHQAQIKKVFNSDIRGEFYDEVTRLNDQYVSDTQLHETWLVNHFVTTLMRYAKMAADLSGNVVSLSRGEWTDPDSEL